MKSKTHRPCKRKVCGKIIPYTLEKYCSPQCKIADCAVSPSKPRTPIKASTTPINRTPLKRNTKPIAKVSKKRQIANLQYKADRIVFLGKPENKICFIDGCNKPSTTIEHRAGRWGNNFLDQTTWAGCCAEHNIELENNPELSKKYQLSKIHGGKKE